MFSLDTFFTFMQSVYFYRYIHEELKTKKKPSRHFLNYSSEIQ